VKILFAFLLSLVGASAIAQDNWKVCFDKKVLLNASTEDEQKNVIEITQADMKKSKSFVVSYKESSPQKGWERTIIIYDGKDSELKKQTGEKLYLKTSELKLLLDRSKTIKIYTLNSPTDPKMKSQVRLRRVHLCTLILQ
jgi:hypothetical protein